MVEQSQDSSASTASGPTGSRPAPPPAPDRHPTGESGPVDRTTPDQLRTSTSVLRLAVFRYLTAHGMHERGVAVRLNKPKTTIHRAIGFLLSIGAIEPNGPPSSHGSVSFYQRGPKAAEFEGGPGGPGGRGVAPHRAGLAVDPHRGTIRLPAIGLPKDPMKLPGFTRHQAPSGAACWWFRFSDPEGNLWSAQLNARKDGRTGTLQITAPTVRTRDLEAALNEEGKRAVAQKEAIRWGQPFGLELARSREAAVQVQPSEYSMPGFGLKPGIGTAGVDRAWTDPSQGRGSLETQDAAVVRAVSTLPEDMQAVLAHIREAQHITPQLREALAGVVRVVEDQLALTGLAARGLAALHSLQTSSLHPKPSPSLLPDSGVDVS